MKKGRLPIIITAIAVIICSSVSFYAIMQVSARTKQTQQLKIEINRLEKEQKKLKTANKTKDKTIADLETTKLESDAQLQKIKEDIQKINASTPQPITDEHSNEGVSVEAFDLSLLTEESPYTRKNQP